jgi:hypothetical protein
MLFDVTASCLFTARWDGWLKDAKQEDAVSWIAQLSERAADKIRGGSDANPD